MNILCRLFGHKWDYFTLYRAADHIPENYRCCMRCEHTERTECLAQDTKPIPSFHGLSPEEKAGWMRQHYTSGRRILFTCKYCGQQVALGWLEKHSQACPLFPQE